MARSEKNRSALYQGLSTVIDEEAVQEMLSYFPARDVEEPVTKEFLRAEMATLRAELKGDMADLRAELTGDMANQRSEFQGGLAGLEQRLGERIGRAQLWNVVTLIALTGTIIAAVRI